jgi:hypothetical protein
MSDRSIDEYENVPTSLTEDEIKRYVNDVIKEFRQNHKDK